MKTIAALLIALLVQCRAAHAATGFETDNLVLYQPDQVLASRIPGAKEFADYAKQLQKVCTEFFESAKTPETLHVVIALKPGARSRVWFVSSTRPDNKGLDPLRKSLESVPAMPVFIGPVAFAISGKIAGGDGKNPKVGKDFQPPIPKEWQEATKGQKTAEVVPDGYLQAVWPDSPEDVTQASAAAPPGFVMQVLEPTGGKVLRPKDWYYTEGHGAKKYMWTISREDISKEGHYTTGVRIQTFVGVKERTGKSGKDFVYDFVSAKKKESSKLIKTCDETDLGLFRRVCLETEEGPHRILYSLFWGNRELDIVVVSIAGTTKELWDTYSSTFNKMSDFVLIDMKRFEK